MMSYISIPKCMVSKVALTPNLEKNYIYSICQLHFLFVISQAKRMLQRLCIYLRSCVFCIILLFDFSYSLFFRLTVIIYRN